MIKNYFKIAVRNLQKNKSYALINIFGLGMGMVAVFIIALFVFKELNYDHHNQFKDLIYRVYQEGKEKSGATQAVLATTVKDKFPEIEQVVRIGKYWRDHSLIRYENRLEKVAPFYFADPEIFQALTIPLLQGSPETCLNDPDALVISRAFSEKYFHGQNPLGKIVTIQFGGSLYDVKVTAVLGEIPENTFLNPDILLPLKFLEKGSHADFASSWGYNSITTLFLLRENALASQFTAKLNEFVATIAPEWFKPNYRLQPLTRAHLYSADIRCRIGMYGNIVQVRLFTAIALAILIIACINFINLSLAQVSRRVKEVGVRKVVGASRAALVCQLVGESLLLVGLALPVALVLLNLLLPYANHIFNRQMQLGVMTNFPFFATMIMIALMVGLVCGGITAFILSSLNPVVLFSQKQILSSGNSWFKRGMLAFQFITFCGLIIASLVIRNQMLFLRDKQVGYNTDQVMVVLRPDGDTNQKYQVFASALQNCTAIQSVTVSSFVPPAFGNWLWTTLDENDNLEWIIADTGYLSVLDLKLVAGRNYRDNEPGAILLNETAFQQKFPGQPFVPEMEIGANNKKRVVGVVHDFHTHDLYQKIGPLFIENDTDNFIACISVKLAAGQIQEGIQQAKQIWQEIYPEDMFSYQFIDEKFDQLYQNDEKFAQLINFFTLLAVVIACMGLFGLSSFAARQRTKEIGIRKTLGATIKNITLLLCREYIIISLVSFVVATPLLHFLMKNWLQHFAYHIYLSWWIFTLAGFIALCIATVTVSWQVIRAACANPAEALRYE
ncbi:MAG TPA: ABC transporter permease [bacterium]|nr:ABC transporter permease [bacterium]HPN45875.1 ABC transporter permease [bacterium]